MSGPRRGPLTGVRVVDAGSLISAPLAAMALGDLGADVVKVEPPQGDAFRRFGARRNGLAVMFASANRNKRSEVLDLKDPGGRAGLHSLLTGADVLLTNWRPGSEPGLGLVDDALRAEHPRLVWTRISGVGRDGPDAGRPMVDAVVQARSGLSAAVGGAAGPVVLPFYLADKLAAAFAAQATLAAIVARDRTGQGTVVDLSMLDVLAYFNGLDVLLERTVLGAGARDGVNRHLGTVQPTATADGWIVIAPIDMRQIRALLEVVGHPEWESGLLAAADSAALAAELYRLLAGPLAAAPTAHWVAACEQRRIPVSAVLEIDEHLADNATARSGTFVTYEHPALGTLRQPRYPGTFDGDRGEAPTPSPPLTPVGARCHPYRTDPRHKESPPWTD